MKMLKLKKSMKNRSAVSPVIATILMVAITVVLAAVLYVMVMGFGGDEGQTPTVSLGNRDGSAANTYDVYVISVSGGDIKYSNVEAVVVSGNAQVVAITGPPAYAAGAIIPIGSHTSENLQAADKAVVQATGDGGSVTVMFKDKVSGDSLGQVTFNVADPTP